MARITKKSDILIYPSDKKYNLKLDYGINTLEYNCKCGSADCTHTIVSPRLLEAWAKVRTFWGRPLKINSGYRCQTHNRAIGGTATSSHSTGHAIDISLDGLIPPERIRVIELCNEYFDYTQVYTAKNFIHGHVNG